MQNSSRLCCDSEVVASESQQYWNNIEIIISYCLYTQCEKALLPPTEQINDRKWICSKFLNSSQTMPLITNDPHSILSIKKIFQDFSSNSEAFASELLDEEMFPLHYMYSDNV